jgi:putative transposase
MNRKPYPTDLSDEQWQLLEPMLPPPFLVGRKRTVDLREVVNAIFYVARTGCPWRYLPQPFPKWTTVYYYFRRWRDFNWFAKLNDQLRVHLRTNGGRKKNASAAIIDSQSVKTTEQGGAKGYDAGKKVNGRKRHILVDTLGLLLCVKVLAGNIHGAKQLFSEIKERMPRQYLIWADGGYRGKLINWVANPSGNSKESANSGDDDSDTRKKGIHSTWPGTYFSESWGCTFVISPSGDSVSVTWQCKNIRLRRWCRLRLL